MKNAVKLPFFLDKVKHMDWLQSCRSFCHFKKLRVGWPDICSHFHCHLEICNSFKHPHGHWNKQWAMTRLLCWAGWAHAECFIVVCLWITLSLHSAGTRAKRGKCNLSCFGPESAAHANHQLHQDHGKLAKQWNKPQLFLCNPTLQWSKKIDCQRSRQFLCWQKNLSFLWVPNALLHSIDQSWPQNKTWSNKQSGDLWSTFFLPLIVHKNEKIRSQEVEEHHAQFKQKSLISNCHKRMPAMPHKCSLWNQTKGVMELTI